MELILENWRQLVKEAEESSATSQRAIEAGLGFTGMASATRKAREPKAYQELTDLGLENAYERATQLYGKDKPGKYFTIRVFLDNLDYIKTKYPEAFPEEKTYSKQEIREFVSNAYTELRKMKPNFKKDPDMRTKYDNALAAMNNLNNAVAIKK